MRLSAPQARALPALAALMGGDVHLERAGALLAVEAGGAAGADRPRLLLLETGELVEARALLREELREEVQRRLEELALDMAGSLPPAERGPLAEALGVDAQWLEHALDDRLGVAAPPGSRVSE